MDARRTDVAEGARQEDITRPTDGAEPGSEANVAPPPTEPSVAVPENEQPLPSLIAPAADAVGQPQ